MSEHTTIMSGRKLYKQYRRRGRLGEPVRAVDEVDLDLRRGEIFGLLGESGSGKSTLGEIMAGLQWPTSGEAIILGNRMFHGMPSAHWRALRQQVQVVFQNPFESVNPRLCVHEIVAEPLEVARLPRDARRAKVDWTLERVGLSPASDFTDRFPRELSGGQLQRVCIARALTVEPTILVADEPVSMLDLSVRASILRLLDQLKREQNMGILLISHDVSTLVSVADRLGVMYLGEFVEMGSTELLLNHPSHPYFKALLAAVPTVSESLLEEGARAITLTSSSMHRPAQGCRLAPRCPLADNTCRTKTQDLLPRQTHEEHTVRCWRESKS